MLFLLYFGMKNTFTAATPLFHFTPGQVYHIQGGSIDGHLFIFVDVNLILEVTDSNPINSEKYGKVGFEAYCSQIRVKNPENLNLSWKDDITRYTPEF